ncbi:hypothetical protein [Pedobacter rhodius]|uniref:MG2 domain-containing protein n=1 Tax=Pedobacter rhodius TaxID=3004098 RepID=A0ABT4KVR7_9SPHI|nr:hypothetical protein [Pedobacter sp. SJ11]MCZ4223027.1 hypothetical protein [Pedobacter sp. SJ11]
MFKRLIPVFVVAFLFSIQLNAQFIKSDSLARILEKYSLQNKSSVLFIHFDKNVYTNNDQVWFTGYLLKNVTDINRYNTLYLSLINNKDSSVVLQHKFLIDKGFSFGSITLPDSIQSGDYRFVANTNIKLNGKPDAEFVQPVAIKSTTINPLSANLSLFKSNDEKTGNGTVLLKALTSDNRFIPNAEVSYIIGRDTHILKTGKAKTNVIGEIMIDYPAGKITAENNLVSVTLKKDKYLRYEKFDIPLDNVNQYQVNFYPEGGYMVANLKNKIGWEVKDAEGSAISAKAVIFVDNKALDTIYTNATGIGSFLFYPQSNQKYTVKLLKDGNLIGNYGIPASLSKGVNIKLNTAIGNDELKILVESNSADKVFLTVHNYENIYLATELKLPKKNPLSVLLKLDAIPAGINTITLLDSLYRPIAERLFFAHYDEIAQLQIDADKEQYNTRDSVKLRLKLFDKKGSQFDGVVSIAVVQANRVSLINKKNIVDYTHLESNLTSLPANSSGIKFNDLNYLDDVLLVKGWRKYKWPQQKDILLADENKISEFEYALRITKGKKTLKLPLSINTIAAGNINNFNTDSAGKFVLPFQSLITEQKSKVWLSLNDKNLLAYDVKINDPFEEIKPLVQKLNYEKDSKKMGMLSSGIENVNALAGIRLNEVTVRKSKDNSISFASFGRNACGDYVCQNRILNCQNHPVGTMPVKGQSYSSNGHMIIYQGCMEDRVKPNFLILNGISLPKEFYVADIKNKNEPINFATVYWNYQTFVNKEGATPITFTSGDLTGEFKIIIQGVTENGVVYGEQTITVKK